MNDKQLEALVNHIALEAGSGLGVGTLYGDMALAVAKEVRERCAKLCRAAQPPGGRQWDEAQAACFAALEHVATVIEGA